jgi:hypothetical protein
MVGPAAMGGRKILFLPPITISCPTDIGIGTSGTGMNLIISSLSSLPHRFQNSLDRSGSLPGVASLKSSWGCLRITVPHTGRYQNNVEREWSGSLPGVASFKSSWGCLRITVSHRYQNNLERETAPYLVWPLWSPPGVVFDRCPGDLFAYRHRRHLLSQI